MTHGSVQPSKTSAPRSGSQTWQLALKASFCSQAEGTVAPHRPSHASPSSASRTPEGSAPLPQFGLSGHVALVRRTRRTRLFLRGSGKENGVLDNP